MKTLQRFTDRIGKRIYRNKLTCDCENCRMTEDYGLVIYNEEHAYNVYAVYCDYNAGGTLLDYRDDGQDQRNV